MMKDDSPAVMIQRIERYFQVPERVAAQLRHTAEKVRGGYILFELRPPWHSHDDAWSKLPVAKLVFHTPSQRWRVYWQRASGRWNLYSQHSQFAAALKAIKTDRYGCFWG